MSLKVPLRRMTDTHNVAATVEFSQVLPRLVDVDRPRTKTITGVHCDLAHTLLQSMTEMTFLLPLSSPGYQ